MHMNEKKNELKDRQETVAYLGGGMPSPPPFGNSENIFLRDALLKMGFQTYIFCSKCRKCRFRDPNFKKFTGGNAPGPPYNCVVTMASPSLKSWLRHWQEKSYCVNGFIYNHATECVNDTIISLIYMRD